MMTKTPQVSPNEMDPINTLELTSIKSLLAYTAYNKRIDEAVVREIFSTHFGIDQVEKLPRKSYDDAIRFLVDIQTEIIN
jgi:hypothetical protein